MSPPNRPEFNDATSDSLLAGLRAGDEGAWREFVPLYAPLIYSWCRRAGLPEVEAGDVTQQVLSKVWVAIGSFNPQGDGASFRGWLMVVTRNAILDRFRALRRTPQPEGGTAGWQRLNQHPDELHQSTQILPSDVSQLAQRALQIVRNSLPPESQRLLELTVIEEKSAPEVAKLLNMAPAAVRKAKSRILRKLRELLGDAS